MKKIIGVRFKRLGKIYFFDPKWLEVKKGENVIVETSQGEEIAEVVVPNRLIEEEKITTPLKKVLRLASQKDLKHAEECRKKEKEAFEVCKKKIKEHGLEMTLTDVEYKFDNSKILFYFTADGRIDFRELCCCSFLRDFETVSIKMAKEQNISLNPSKISGNCGRLMCCLKYEQDVYEDKLKRLPNVGAIVKTPDGEGEIDSTEILKEVVRVKFKNGDIFNYKKYPVSEIKVIKDTVKEHADEEEKQYQKELEELEELGNEDLEIKNENEE